MKIKPLFDRVVIRPEIKKEKLSGGIILPEKSESSTQIGTIVSVGNGAIYSGEKSEMQLHEGDKVLYALFAGTKISVDNEILVVLRQTDVLAILEGK